MLLEKYNKHNRTVPLCSNPVVPAWNRTLDSIVEEWRLHNFAHAFGYKPERTADCDFNNADEGKGFWDFVGR